MAPHDDRYSFGEKCRCLTIEDIHVAVDQEAPTNPAHTHGNIRIGGWVGRKTICAAATRPYGGGQSTPPVTGDFRHFYIDIHLEYDDGECACELAGQTSCYCRKEINMFVPAGYSIPAEAQPYVNMLTADQDEGSGTGGISELGNLANDILDANCPQEQDPAYCCTLFDRVEPPGGSSSFGTSHSDSVRFFGQAPPLRDPRLR